MIEINWDSLRQAMELLGHLMVAGKRPKLHLVGCGGSALIALNHVTRTTLGHGGFHERL